MSLIVVNLLEIPFSNFQIDGEEERTVHRSHPELAVTEGRSPLPPPELWAHFFAERF